VHVIFVHDDRRTGNVIDRRSKNLQDR